MLERARRILSFIVASLAIFAVGRVVVAYATRPSRWSTRFARSVGNVSAVGFGDGAPVPPTADDLATIAGYRVQMYAFVMSSADVAGYARRFSQDAITVTTAGIAVAGRIALEEAIRRTLAMGQIVDARLVSTQCRALNDTVVEEGDYRFGFRRGETEIVFKGRLTALWKREMGEWRIVFEAVRAGENEIVGP